MRTDHEQSQNVTRDKRAEQAKAEREAARFKPDDEYYQRRKNTILSAIQGTIDNARKHSHKQARVAHEAQYNSHVKELKKVQSNAKEDGFEVSILNDLVENFTQNLIDSGAELIGLGARDTLRLEAGLCLYGHELDLNKTPIEANLKWAISKERLSNGGFLGSDKIIKQIQVGPKLSLIHI